MRFKAELQGAVIGLALLAAILLILGVTVRESAAIVFLTGLGVAAVYALVDWILP